MQVQPYLFFDGRCEEALNYYRRVLGAEIQALMRYKESPDPSSAPPGGSDKVMHAAFKVGDTQVLASDGHTFTSKPDFQGFGLTIDPPNQKEAERIFNALADGGKVQLALTKTFFAERFGMVADRFGILWMIIVGQAQ